MTDLSQEQLVTLALSERVCHGRADFSAKLHLAELESSIDKVAQVCQKLRVVLLNEIIHFTSKESVEDPTDPRKTTKYLRDLVAALCGFYFQGQFFIPRSWNNIGIITKNFNV